ncbi:MAG: ATP-binding cassette domain-containing protein [Gemmatimonadota bacterium]|nr:ATP-binding cassette domain-containing protein [Gemmatimonadota bacterium]
MFSVDGVTKRFGDLTAVDTLSFEIHRGEVVGFLGPNGAGKTTTMRMIVGGLEPDEGRILFDGRPLQDDLIGARRRIGFLPEANPLYDGMLVCEYLEHVGRLRELEGETLRRAVREAADETDLGAVFFRPIGELSKGYRQRVGLAGAILHKPELLVLDEPTEGLDPNQRVEIRRLVSTLGRERTVLLSTHVMQEVEATCSRLLILSAGRLIADGTVQDLAAARSGGVTLVVEAEGVDVEASLAALDGVAATHAEALPGRTRVTLQTIGGLELRPRIFELAKDRAWTLWELRQERANLEDLFRRLTSGEEV